MPFTVVPDKATGDIFTEQMWDTYIRDNGNWLGKATGAATGYLPTAVQTIPASTWTKVNLTAESIDVSGWFDTTNSRYVPQAAGVYLFAGQCLWSTAAANVVYLTALYKNGAIYSTLGRFTTSAVATVGGTQIAVANGTTDYFELYCQQISAGSLDVGSGLNTYLSCVYLGTQ